MPSYFILPALLLGYYLIVWWRVGRDPKPGTIAPQYEPPEELSPAAVRYLRIAGSDGKSLAAVLADLAYQRRISIVPEKGSYQVALLKTSSTFSSLPSEEQRVLDLLSAYGETVTISPSDSQRNSVLITAIQGSLNKRLGNLYFSGNYSYILTAVAISMAAAMVWAGNSPEWEHGGGVFLTYGFLAFSLIIGAIVVIRVIPALKDAFLGKISISAISVMLLVMSSLLIMSAFIAYRIAQEASQQFAGMLVAVVVIHLIFGPLLKAPTKKGRALMDQIEGYRQFLVGVEQGPLDKLNAPGSPPKLLNESLPYAIALDIKQAWGDHLSEAFFAATVSKGG